ncbi:hypothetical protein [Methylobacterium variabile]|nr:hypothetical protein [Methylobacterium variabile]
MSLPPQTSLRVFAVPLTTVDDPAQDEMRILLAAPVPARPEVGTAALR